MKTFPDNDESDFKKYNGSSSNEQSPNNMEDKIERFASSCTSTDSSVRVKEEPADFPDILLVKDQTNNIDGIVSTVINTTVSTPLLNIKQEPIDIPQIEDGAHQNIPENSTHIISPQFSKDPTNLPDVLPNYKDHISPHTLLENAVTIDHSVKIKQEPLDDAEISLVRDETNTLAIDVLPDIKQEPVNGSQVGDETNQTTYTNWSNLRSSAQFSKDPSNLCDALLNKDDIMSHTPQPIAEKLDHSVKIKQEPLDDTEIFLVRDQANTLAVMKNSFSGSWDIPVLDPFLKIKQEHDHSSNTMLEEGNKNVLKNELQNKLVNSLDKDADMSRNSNTRLECKIKIKSEYEDCSDVSLVRDQTNPFILGNFNLPVKVKTELLPSPAEILDKTTIKSQVHVKKEPLDWSEICLVKDQTNSLAVMMNGAKKGLPVEIKKEPSTLFDISTARYLGTVSALDLNNIKDLNQFVLSNALAKFDRQPLDLLRNHNGLNNSEVIDPTVGGKKLLDIPTNFENSSVQTKSADPSLEYNMENERSLSPESFTIFSVSSISKQVEESCYKDGTINKNCQPMEQSGFCKVNRERHSNDSESPESVNECTDSNLDIEEIIYTSAPVTHKVIELSDSSTDFSDDNSTDIISFKTMSKSSKENIDQTQIDTTRSGSQNKENSMELHSHIENVQFGKVEKRMHNETTNGLNIKLERLDNNKMNARSLGNGTFIAQPFPTNRFIKREIVSIKDENGIIVENMIESKMDLFELLKAADTELTNKKICKWCGAQFDLSSDFSEHVIRMHKRFPDSHICKQCGRIFETSADLIFHYKLHKGFKPYQCNKCGRKFKDSEAFSRHLRMHAGDKPYSCTKCKETFMFQRQLAAHYKTHKGKHDLKFSCPKCGSNCKTHMNLIQHMKLHDTIIYTCEVCNREFLKEMSKLRHMHAIHRPIQKIPLNKNYKCTYCDKAYSCKQSLNDHLFKNHLGPDQNKEVQIFKCSQCDRTFKSCSRLASHVKLHTGADLFCCNECGKAFCHRNLLETHMHIHNGQRSYPCSKCDKSYLTKVGLTSHLEKHNINPVSCKICNKTYNSKRAFSNHMRMHQEKCQECKRCGITFTSTADLTVHMKSHLSKPFKCELCMRSYKLRGDFVRHMKIHTGVRPFIHMECGKSFYSKYASKLHSKRCKGLSWKRDVKTEVPEETLMDDDFWQE